MSSAYCRFTIPKYGKLMKTYERLKLNKIENPASTKCFCALLLHIKQKNLEEIATMYCIVFILNVKRRFRKLDICNQKRF